MNMPLGPYYRIAKLSLFGLLTIFAASCNTLKKVTKDDYLIVKNTISADSVVIKSEIIKSLIYQKPNATLFGYPLRLNLFNLAKDTPDADFQEWLYKKPKRLDRLNKLLSNKQVNRLAASFLVSGLSEWLKEIGEAPVLLDTVKTRKTLQRLSAYYGNRGYFNNTTTYTIDSLSKKQRALVTYSIKLGKPYLIDTLTAAISSKIVDTIYHRHKEQSFIKKGQQFDLNNFTKERERLTSVFRNNGIRNFQESSIAYDIERDTTVANNDKKINIVLNISDFKLRGENKVTTTEYEVEKIKDIHIYTDHLAERTNAEITTTVFEDYTIHHSKNFRIKPKTLANAIAFKKDTVYRDLDKIRTSKQLNNLNTFKYPSILFEKDSTAGYINTHIYLAPKTKYSLGTNIDISRSNIRKLGVGLGASLLIRNIFRGAENLSISASSTFGLLSNASFQEDFFSEIGADITLDFPRIWFPFLNTTKIIPNYTLPNTRIALGTSFQKNIGLDKQTLNAIIGYNWTPNLFVKNAVELFNIQFVRNVNSNRFFNVYENTYNQLNTIAQNENITINPDYFTTDNTLTTQAETQEGNVAGTSGFISDVVNGIIPISTTGLSQANFEEVSSIREREQRLTENNLIFSTSYTFQKNNRAGLSDNSFYQLRLKLESAGNLLSGLSSVVPFNEEDNQLLIFGVPFSQYIKTEIDFVKYWNVSRSNILAARAFIGIAVPYGNSNNIPFVRSYFAGGSNDNRAWFPYSLGPGSTSAVNDFNEANLKLAGNLEYRFPIAGKVNGAIFADAGNIWNVFDDVEDPDAIFNGFSSLKDIAIGSGFGIRYDFTYFLFRLDLGFKTYNPAEKLSQRWFREYNFANSVLQIGINYPF